jgi:hypothetical protein
MVGCVQIGQALSGIGCHRGERPDHGPTIRGVEGQPVWIVGIGAGEAKISTM